MSQANVEVARRFSEHFTRTGEVDFSVIAPDAVFDNSNAMFDGAVYRGHDGVRTYLALLRGMWEGIGSNHRSSSRWARTGSLSRSAWSCAAGMRSRRSPTLRRSTRFSRARSPTRRPFRARPTP